MITTTDMLRWLDGKRSEVNTRIVAAPPDEEGRYHGELKIINAICERVRRGELGSRGASQDQPDAVGVGDGAQGLRAPSR